MVYSFKDNQQQLYSLIDRLEEGVFYQKMDGSLQNVNAAALKLFGLTREEFGEKIKDLSTWQIIDENNRSLSVEQFPSQIAFETGKPVKDVILGFFNPQKHDYVWVKVNAFPVDSLTNSASDEVCVILTDITAVRQIKHQLNKHRKELRIRVEYEDALKKLSSVLLHETDVDAGMNKVLEYLRFVSDAKRVYIFENFSHPELGLCMRQRYEVCAEGVQSEINNSDLQKVSYHPAFTRWYDMLSAGKHVSGFVKEFPESEQQVLAAQQIQSILIIPIMTYTGFYGFIGFDETDFKREWGEGNIQLLYTAAEHIGSFLERKKSEQEMSEAQKLLNMVIKDLERKVRQRTSELQYTQKKLQELNTTLEQKVNDRTDEVTALLKEKEDFINQLSHDLKNPIGPIVNLLPMVIEDVTDPVLLKDLDVIYRNARYMKKLIMDTLKLARLEQLEHGIEVEQFDLYRLAENVIEDNQLSFNDKIAIQNNVDRNLVGWGDPLRIKEVFNNLISNAVHYSKDKKSLIRIDGYKQDDVIYVSVRDQGIGMNLEQVSHIFDEFYKADDSRHDKEASGLGLAICKKIIQKHGGRIWAESPGIGKGSTFYFTLPDWKGKSNFSIKKKTNQPI
ncbi:MAG TPA: ATP-binding protein [Candidatus Thermoplasmatota archaeon]|nr:ATP-binding protein [Candidatus Thermoplasmatota archaeon]